MALTLMYITNSPAIAEIAQSAGVDRIWVDMEYIGKDARQGGLDTVKSHHTVEDVKRLRPFVTNSMLQVRVNPVHDATALYPDTETEVDEVIDAGADVVMLPMFREKSEVARFLRAVNGRAKTLLLFETARAVQNAEDILSLPGIDEAHVGLNDLHLAYGMKFMFELVADGSVERLCGTFREHGLKYGFGGIARIGGGALPAEYVITEHYRIGSTAAILSRAFCDVSKISDLNQVRDLFSEGVRRIREKEREAETFTKEQFLENLALIKEKVERIKNGCDE